MLEGGFKEGEAVYRIKTDLKNPNPAIRDWPALRIINSHRYPHPRVGSKYIVWPLYNFACGIDDHLMEITHIIRGKEHYTNMEKQKYLYNYLGWIYPEAIHYGRLRIKNAFLSKSKIVEGISNGLFHGWSDPRLATLKALCRRGITPLSIKMLIMDIGPKSSDVVISWKNLYSYNRKNLDLVANRYFFVADPVKVKVKKIPKIFDIKICLHPSQTNRGSREYSIKPEGNDNSVIFWIAKKDIKCLKLGSIIRFIDLFNIKIDKITKNLVEASFNGDSLEEVRKSSNLLIQWVLNGENTKCQIVMPDASVIKGFVESFCRTLSPHEIVQFKRFGFVRFDKVGEEIIAYFAHR
jgi:glutamyl-tRNA synthetase